MSTPTVKPLTLSIIPQASTVSQSVTIPIGKNPVVSLPTFQYNPIIPSILQPTTPKPVIPIPVPSPIGRNPVGVLPIPPPVPESTIPVIIPPPAYGITIRNPKSVAPTNATPKEKLEYQRQADRDKQKRYRDKTRAFIDIAKLPTINERIKRVVTLTYPNINEQIDETHFNNAINQFVASLFMPSQTPHY